jgi:hypothetical protein
MWPSVYFIPKLQEWIMARFWLFIANSIGILIVVLLLMWMAGVIQ